MEIEGRLGTYKCSWKEYGWSYARPVIRRKLDKKTFFGGLKSAWYVVWDDSPEVTLCSQAEKMKPDEMKSWFKSAINEYEDYAEAWEKHNN